MLIMNCVWYILYSDIVIDTSFGEKSFSIADITNDPKNYGKFQNGNIITSREINI